MVNGGQPYIFTEDECPVFPRDAVIRPDNPLCGNTAQTDDDFWAQKQGFVFQIGHAGFLLLGERVSVARRMAFYNIGKIYILTFHANAGCIIIKALRAGISIYSAHTNLDRATHGVSMEIAAALGLNNVKILEPDDREPLVGLGAVGDIGPMPSFEFLRKVKEAFAVKCLRYSSSFSSLIVRKVAVCGGAGASLIRKAVDSGADAIVTGDVKYHDFTTWGSKNGSR